MDEAAVFKVGSRNGDTLVSTETLQMWFLQFAYRPSPSSEGKIFSDILH
jgi:hypothetical protein